jgi:MFS family permease
MFMDVSSEMVHSLLPLFLVGTLGASAVFVGVIEGVGEATASFAKLFSGVASDWLNRRKMLIVLGYGLGAVSKPFFALASTAEWVLAARFADRIGKGIRGAPRDALIADITPGEIRGRAYGLRQALDTIGAFAGPLLAVALMALFADDMRLVFWCAVIPGAIAAALVMFGVQDRVEEKKTGQNWEWQLWRALPRRFWIVAAIGAMFTLARFSEAFLVLRAHQTGLAVGLAPLVLVVMNVVYAAGAYPGGVLADRLKPEPLLLAGLGALILADLALIWAANLAVVALGLALWGVHMALTQGLLSKLVAGSAPAELRATSFGVFNAGVGVATLLASVVAGALWETAGAEATFWAGAGFAAMAAAGLAWVWRRGG